MLVLSPFLQQNAVWEGWHSWSPVGKLLNCFNWPSTPHWKAQDNYRDKQFFSQSFTSCLFSTWLFATRKLFLVLLLSLSQPSTFYLLHFTWRSSSLGLTMICLFHSKQFRVPRMLSLLQSWLYQEQKQSVLKESCVSGSLTNRKKASLFWEQYLTSPWNFH